MGVRNGLSQGVSIHSPHRSEERLSTRAASALLGEFQSTPLTEVRGDLFDAFPEARVYGFQSTPLTEVRGDSDRRSSLDPPRTFQSTPLTEVRGDHPPSSIAHTSRWFQSTPLTEVRGDMRLPRSSLKAQSSFNPLPSPK